VNGLDIKERLIACAVDAEKTLQELGIDDDKVGDTLLEKNVGIEFRELPTFTPAYYDPQRNVIGISPRGIQMDECGKILAHEILHAVVKLPDHHHIAKIQCDLQKMFLGKKECEFYRPLPPGENCFMLDIKHPRLDSQCFEDVKRRSYIKKD